MGSLWLPLMSRLLSMSQNATAPVLCVLLLSLSTMNAQAESRAFAGLGLVNTDSHYIDTDALTTVEPLVYLQSDKWLVDGPQVTYRFNPYIGLSGIYWADRFDALDSTVLDRLDERRFALDIGLQIGLPGANLTITENLNDRYGGTNVRLKLGRSFHWNNIEIVPNAQVDWLSRQATNHFYGVSDGESLNSGVGAYNANKGVITSVGVFAAIPFKEKLSFIARVDYLSFSSSITNSSIVSADDEVSANLGVVYNFY